MYLGRLYFTMNSRFFIIFCLMLLASLPTQAQSDPIQFTHLNNDNGLSNNHIQCILKDSRSFMWFGTASGLNRYDGYSCKIFRHNAQDTTSISNNSIHTLFEDPEGKLWAYTGRGWNVYDPVTEVFHRNIDAYLKKYAIPYHDQLQLLKDSKGNYWFFGTASGLYKYIPAQKKTIAIRHIPNNSRSLGTPQVFSMKEDQHGNFWMVHSNGTVELLDGKTYQVLYRTLFIEKPTASWPSYKCFVDNDNDLWVYSISEAKGVYYFNTREKKVRHIDKSSAPSKLNNDIIRSLTQDENGLIWIGTDHGGINLVSKKDFSIRYLLHNEDNKASIGQNSISQLYKDNSGIIWAGTLNKGLSYYHKNIIRFGLYKHQPSNPKSLPFNDIGCFAEDKKGNIWIGTNGEGIIYFDRAAGTFKQFMNDPNNPNSPSSNVVVSMCMDHEQKLWIGTYYGNLDCYDGKKFIHYQNNPADPTSLSNTNVWEILEDSTHNLWIGTLGSGLDYFDREKGKFYHYRVEDKNTVQSNFISSLTKDKQGNLWIATASGIDVLNRLSGRFTHYDNYNNRLDGLSSNSVLSILEDSRGLLWVGTLDGLNLFDKTKKTFQNFRQSDGLPDNIIRAILEDDQHNLWLSTTHGLSNLIVSKDPKSTTGYHFRFKNYNESDGLQGKEFNENTALKTSKGELIFGGTNGFNIFHPQSIQLNKELPKVVLTDFQLLNKSITTGEKVNGRALLSKAISETKEIILNPGENGFSIEFAAVSYFQPEKQQYMYQLEGLDKTWIPANSKLRKATYTNLNPGEYTFRVKASNNEGDWNNQPTSINIVVLPPFWKTPWAYLLYVLLITLSLVLAHYIIQERERMKFYLAHERQEAHRLNELNLMKIKFFTNISHEFRTPLSLILAPLDKMLKAAPEPDQQNQLSLIHRNARRLLILVNQLLDFRKMEVQELKLHATKGDIISFIKEIIYSFSDISEKKNIHITYWSAIDNLDMLFDQDKLERILFNLLSNAFKFTPGQGKIAVQVSLLEEDISESSNGWLQIQVIDTGIGIPVEKQDKVFEPFFQNDTPGSIVNQGSGIGLSITKEFVKLHGGTISVESEPEKGSTFTVLLPVRHAGEVSQLQPAVQETIQKPNVASKGDGTKKQINQKPVILLVEDNEDFRFYLKDNLKEQYTIVEAANGKEAWHQIPALMPDLVVSDVMMPEMDGIELCHRIKGDKRTAAIQVILLTARGSEEQKLEGFETGAIDYITKPFNFEILQARIRNLIAQRNAFKKSLQEYIEIKPTEIAITSQGDKLIKDAMSLVEQNMANPDFSVEEMSRELGVSRVQLYKKLLSLTGKSPVEFIRLVRLKRAAQLLEKSELTVAEIAYQVGYNNPKYFAKHFKMQFNVLPSVYANRKQKPTV